MKKILNLLFVFLLFILCVQPVRAVLATQTQKQSQKQPTKQQTYRPNNSKSNNNIKATPVISNTQKQKYYNDYAKYIEQTIIDLGCFSSNDIANANISINLSFDSSYNVSSANVNFRALRNAKGQYLDINNDEYNRKCKYCESKIYMTKFKPFESKYSGLYSTKDFYITLKSSETVKNLSTERIIQSLKDYCWTPPYNSNNQFAIVKVTLNFNQKSFGIKSYGITNNSGDKEYNTMVEAAFRKWMQQIGSDYYVEDINHNNGDLTIYLKFINNNIYASSEAESIMNKQTVYPNSTKVPSFENMFFDSGSSIFP